MWNKGLWNVDQLRNLLETREVDSLGTAPAREEFECRKWKQYPFCGLTVELCNLGLIKNF
jgi:hypothetical protein